MELVTAAEMRQLDRAAIETRSVPSLRLMENAGKAVVQEMERSFGLLRGKTVTCYEHVRQDVQSTAMGHPEEDAASLAWSSWPRRPP